MRVLPTLCTYRLHFGCECDWNPSSHSIYELTAKLQFLQIPHREQLFRVQMGDLIFSTCLERVNWLDFTIITTTMLSLHLQEHVVHHRTSLGSQKSYLWHYLMQDSQQVAASDQSWLISEKLSRIRSKLHFIYISNLDTTNLTEWFWWTTIWKSQDWPGPASK